MNKKVDELYTKINELMEARDNFDVNRYDKIFHEIESIIGKEVNRKDERKMEKELAENMQKMLLSTLDGKASLDMVSTAEQIIMQTGNDYRTLKTKYMHDGIAFFIVVAKQLLGTEDAIKPKEKSDDQKEIYAEMQEALDKPEGDDRGK